MKKYLTFKKGTSSKFWNIEVSGKSFTVIFGEPGKTPLKQTKIFYGGEQECLNEARKVLKEKLKSGYEESDFALRH